MTYMWPMCVGPLEASARRKPGVNQGSKRGVTKSAKPKARKRR